MAISLLEDELAKECDGNMFTENYNKYYCKKLLQWYLQLCLFFIQNKSFFKTGSRHFQMKGRSQHFQKCQKINYLQCPLQFN